jgi:NAD(P)-dependent dehydrogenase (short-subunit alcohol dehydrogenase family)
MSRSRAVLVTGCSSGVGAATVRRLAARGWKVYATARRPESLRDLEPVSQATLPLDLTSDASMAAAVGYVEAREGAVGALVNNAGYMQGGAVEVLTPEQIRCQFETNVFGLVRLTQLVLPGMRRQGWGRIVNVGSMGGRMTLPGGGIYHASKYALEALSDALRFEVRRFGIHVVVVQPGLIRSSFSSRAVGSIPAADSGPYADFHASVARATRDSYVQGFLGRLTGEPEHVAKVIARALEARRPRSRYKVTFMAHAVLGLRVILPDRLWDALLRLVYAQPG